MWRNPNYDHTASDEQSEAKVAPRQTGQLVAAIRRPDHGYGEDEVRVALDAYQGHPYISVRLWHRDGPGADFWPTRKGMSVRIGEADAVAEAILEAASLAESWCPDSGPQSE